MFSLSDPTNLTAAGSLDFPGEPSDVAVEGNYVYVAAGEFGLQILWAGPPQDVRLRADRVGDQVQLRWPVSASSYLLERTAGLSTSQWQTVRAPGAG